MAGSGWQNIPVQAWESPDYEPSLPVSEKSNPLSRDIDRASANQIVRILQTCDAQMFQKNECCSPYKRLLSEQVVKTVMEVALRVELILKDPESSLIVLSGCGTSGRLAFLTATGFNRALVELKQKPVYTYIIAGGDRALLTSQETPEDDPKLGMLTLKQVCEGKKHVLFVGISCGLSAPFVAGQLDFCLQHLDVYTPVLIGFNPAHQARDDAMQGCTFTFHEVVQRLQKAAACQKAFLINPSVGPEAISGSSRMKGGSATKILLEVIMCAAHAAAFAHRPITHRCIQQHMADYAKTLDVTYAQSEGIAAVMKSAAQSLHSGGRVCYLGWGSLAVLGLIDASECNPTFGADYNDVRGFINGGGYSVLNNKEGPLISLGSDYCISHEDFLHTVLPSLNNQDTVLMIYSHSDNLSDVAKMAKTVREKTSKLHAVYHHTEGCRAAEQIEIHSLCSITLPVTWPSLGSENVQHIWELSTKLLLNAVSTGAHVLKGKIYQNHMIDVQVTNSKLYRRATRLLQKFSGRPELECQEALLKAIYGVDELTVDITSSDINAHTKAATKRTKVVPLALVCLHTGCSLSEAESHLGRQTIVRDAVEACLS